MLQLSTFLRLVLKEVAIQNPAIEIDEISAETPETPETSETSGASLDDIKVEGIGSSVHSKIRDQAPILLAKQIDLATATEVIEVFRYGGTLHKDSVMNILRKAYAKLKAAPNVVNVSLPAQGKLTVVGDIHGQLADLLHILDECGLPSPTNKYIFNGDFVDRGPNGVEVVCILFALYIAEPDNVTLVRGNHEDILITKVYGFQDECVSKYDSLVFGMFTEVFKYLPLFSLVDNSIFVVHGGLFNNRQVKISDLEKIARFDYVAKPEIPYPKCNEGLDADGQWAEYYKQLQRDALWSDPMIEDGLRDNPRGAGVFFGPNIAQAFMDLNRVSMIIRAHECVNTGFFLPYAQTANPANLTANTPLLCTLFSASNYGGAGNDGAYLVVMAHSHTNSFAVGSTGLHYSVHNFNCSSDSSGNALETASTSSLSELIVKKKAALRVAFEAKDVEGTGWVTRLQWSEVMQQVTTIRIRWLSLLSDLASSKCLTSTHVDYRKFLSSFRVQSKRIPQSASNVPAPAVMDALYGQRKKLEAVFNYFDVNGDGVRGCRHVYSRLLFVVEWPFFLLC